MNYRCGGCNKEWVQNDKSCSNCGSTRRVEPVFAEGKISFRSGFMLESHNLLSGKIDRKIFSRSKQSGETHREAKEYRDIDIEHNKYFEKVEELDENEIGKKNVIETNHWKVITKERKQSEPLKNLRKSYNK